MTAAPQPMEHDMPQTLIKQLVRLRAVHYQQKRCSCRWIGSEWAIGDGRFSGWRCIKNGGRSGRMGETGETTASQGQTACWLPPMLKTAYARPLRLQNDSSTSSRTSLLCLRDFNAHPNIHPSLWHRYFCVLYGCGRLVQPVYSGKCCMFTTQAKGRFVRGGSWIPASVRSLLESWTMHGAPLLTSVSHNAPHQTFWVATPYRSLPPSPHATHPQHPSVSHHRHPGHL